MWSVALLSIVFPPLILSTHHISHVGVIGKCELCGCGVKIMQGGGDYDLPVPRPQPRDAQHGSTVTLRLN